MGQCWKSNWTTKKQQEKSYTILLMIRLVLLFVDREYILKSIYWIAVVRQCILHKHIVVRRLLITVDYLDIKPLSYQYRNSLYKDKTVVIITAILISGKNYFILWQGPGDHNYICGYKFAIIILYIDMWRAQYWFYDTSLSSGWNFNWQPQLSEFLGGLTTVLFTCVQMCCGCSSYIISI